MLDNRLFNDDLESIVKNSTCTLCIRDAYVEQFSTIMVNFERLLILKHFFWDTS